MKEKMTHNKTRKIIHCDADCFFAALEMRDDPSLRGIPMAVGGDPGRRGVISTCNYEARAFGVRSALASAYAKKLCPQLVIVPHRMTKYKEAAEQLREIFLDYTDVIEPLSLDEAFLDVSNVDFFCGSATLIAEDIRRRVHREMGITVSAGIAPNKFLAKVASDWDKPNGLTVIEPSRVTFFVNQLPVRCIPGVGPQTEEKLKRLGIDRCLDIIPYSEVDLVDRFGKFGRRLYHFSRGDDERPVVTSYQRKSMSVEHTLAHDISVDECHPVIEQLYEKLLARLQAGTEAHTLNKVFIKIKFMDFSRTSIEIKADAISLGLCESLFCKAWHRSKKPVRLLGLGVRFANASNMALHRQQLDLFDGMNSE
jgi:DNA polymerase-4